MQDFENFPILLQKLTAFSSTNQHNVKSIDLICTESIENKL